MNGYTSFYVYPFTVLWQGAVKGAEVSVGPSVTENKARGEPVEI